MLPAPSHPDAARLAALIRPGMREHLEHELLPRYLSARRWYAAKDAGPPDVRIVQAETFAHPRGAALLALVRVVPPGQPPQIYFVPLALSSEAPHDERSLVGALSIEGESRHLIDALADDASVRALVAAMRDGVPRGAVRFMRTRAFPEGIDLAEGTIARPHAEQSNSSVIVAGAMLKAFRRVQPGVHPEIEMTRHLTERTEFRRFARLLGAVELSAPDGAPTVVCALQALIPNRGDGWTVAVNALERIARGETRPAQTQLIALAARLGARTAELHVALAAASDDPAFAPEPITAADRRQWREAVAARARSALAGVRQAQPRLMRGAAALANRLCTLAPEIDDRIAALADTPLDAVRTRVHGDYHLGQVLVGGSDVYVIDFEGEPMRPLAERRAKQCVLRDVAGMLRSFSYAAAAALYRDRGGSEGGATRLDAATAAMSQAFLAIYADAMRGCPSFPPAPQARRVLELFLLEKALYEIDYEIANRPDWVAIPLAGVLTLLRGTPADGEGSA
ncbi:MAG TPA: putative maltokinase [Burkholderiales bacterium]